MHAITEFFRRLSDKNYYRDGMFLENTRKFVHTRFSELECDRLSADHAHARFNITEISRRAHAVETLTNFTQTLPEHLECLNYESVDLYKQRRIEAVLSERITHTFKKIFVSVVPKNTHFPGTLELFLAVITALLIIPAIVTGYIFGPLGTSDDPKTSIFLTYICTAIVSGAGIAAAWHEVGRIALWPAVVVATPFVFLFAVLQSLSTSLPNKQTWVELEVDQFAGELSGAIHQKLISMSFLLSKEMKPEFRLQALQDESGEQLKEIFLLFRYGKKPSEVVYLWHEVV